MINLKVKLTNRCNLKCYYCSHGSIDREITGELNVDNLLRFIDIISQGTDTIQLEFFGGEPTLVELSVYEKIVSHCSSLHTVEFKYRMTSNMTVLLNDCEYLTVLHELGIHVSYSNQHYFSDIPDKVVELLEYTTHLQGEPTDITTVISKLNQDNLIDIHKNMSMYSDICSHSFILQSYTGVDTGVDMGKVFNYVKQIVSDPTYKYDTLCALLIGKLVSIVEDYDCICDHCYKHSLLVLPDGTITHCNLPNAETVKRYGFGNICGVKTLSDIYNSEGYLRFLGDIQKKVTECSKCELSSYCRVGCFTSSSYDYQGDVSKCSQRYTEMQRLLMLRTFDILDTSEVFHAQVIDRLHAYGKLLPSECTLNEDCDISRTLQYIKINKDRR